MRTFFVLFSFIFILAACSPENQEAKSKSDVAATPESSQVQDKSVEVQQAQPETAVEEASAPVAEVAQVTEEPAKVVEHAKVHEKPSAPAVAKTYVAGTDFELIENPVATITPGKIEVTEVFWYGCGHCFSFEPIINAWSQGLASDVELVKSPAIWRQNMEAHARIFYTAKALGILDTVHSKVFEAMHHKRAQLVNQDEIREFFKQFNVAPEKFDSIFNSFAVNSQIQLADSRARSFMITGTPEIVVDGRFRISAKSAGGQEQMLEVVDYLVKQIRDKNI